MNFRDKLTAYQVYLIYRGATSFFFALMFTVNMVYMVTLVGMNPLELVLIGTMLEISAFVFEVPSGIVADVYSRRLSVIIGVILLGISNAIAGAIPVFIVIFLIQILSGIGYTFISGASEAWIVDEIGQENAAPAFLRAQQVGQATGLVGIFFSVILASVQIQIPIVLGGCLFIGLAVFLILFMPEEGFQATPPDERESWNEILNTFRNGIRLVRGHHILIVLLLSSIIYGAFTEGYDRLWTAHILENFTLPQLGDFDQIVWFGVIAAVSSLITIPATSLVRNRLDFNKAGVAARMLTFIYGGIAISIFVFALSDQLFPALIAIWSINILRSLSYPIFSAWINQHVESSVRATVLSFTAQSDAFGQIVGGPGVGWIGTRFSLRVALSISGILLIPSLPLLLRTTKQKAAY